SNISAEFSLKDKHQIGDLSPKDFHPWSQRLNRFSHFRPSTGSSRLSPTFDYLLFKQKFH
ncbi:MAG: hypothetical protein LBT09_00595, partial [Planctomycetaceae bacterium]|nr:hypothetical protein [Planctomycetaceae bacterium]